MDKKPLIVVSLCAVVLLVLGSLSNVVGIENVQGCGCDDPQRWPEISGSMGQNNWYVSYVNVTFNEIFNIYYRINESNWIIYTEPFTIKTQGIHLLEWANDTNSSNIYSLEIKIDWSSPLLSNYTSKRIGLFKWQFGVNATDGVSGINRVQFPLWNFGHNIDTEPPYQFVWRGCMILFSLSQLITHNYFWWNAWDNAGNMAPQPHAAKADIITINNS